MDTAFSEVRGTRRRIAAPGRPGLMSVARHMLAWHAFGDGPDPAMASANRQRYGAAQRRLGRRRD